MRRKVSIISAGGFVGYHLISAAAVAGIKLHAAKIPQLQHFNLRYVIPEHANISERVPSVHMFQIHVPASFIKYTNNKRF